jgi:hypothetical protein
MQAHRLQICIAETLQRRVEAGYTNTHIHKCTHRNAHGLQMCKTHAYTFKDMGYLGQHLLMQGLDTQKVAQHVSDQNNIRMKTGVQAIRTGVMRRHF